MSRALAAAPRRSPGADHLPAPGRYAQVDLWTAPYDATFDERPADFAWDRPDTGDGLVRSVVSVRGCAPTS